MSGLQPRRSLRLQLSLSRQLQQLSGLPDAPAGFAFVAPAASQQQAPALPPLPHAFKTDADLQIFFPPQAAAGDAGCAPPAGAPARKARRRAPRGAAGAGAAAAKREAAPGGTSRYRGVCWNRKNRRWQAAINAGGKYIYLGSFLEEPVAAAAFDRAAIKLRGERTHLNFEYRGYVDAHGNLIDDIDLEGCKGRRRARAAAAAAAAAPPPPPPGAPPRPLVTSAPTGKWLCAGACAAPCVGRCGGLMFSQELSNLSMADVRGMLQGAEQQLAAGRGVVTGFAGAGGAGGGGSAKPRGAAAAAGGGFAAAAAPPAAAAVDVAPASQPTPVPALPLLQQQLMGQHQEQQQAPPQQQPQQAPHDPFSGYPAQFGLGMGQFAAAAAATGPEPLAPLPPPAAAAPAPAAPSRKRSGGARACGGKGAKRARAPAPPPPTPAPRPAAAPQLPQLPAFHASAFRGISIDALRCAPATTPFATTAALAQAPLSDVLRQMAAMHPVH